MKKEKKAAFKAALNRKFIGHQNFLLMTQYAAPTAPRRAADSNPGIERQFLTGFCLSLIHISEPTRQE
ncbi:hypothetical protein, partial [Methanosarcina mazei]|uniref:hypothetical protein n=1 Tax=Methanosarcina mazei TaxID=2209 RepID=UPI00064FDA66